MTTPVLQVGPRPDLQQDRTWTTDLLPHMVASVGQGPSAASDLVYGFSKLHFSHGLSGSENKGGRGWLLVLRSGLSDGESVSRGSPTYKFLTAFLAEHYGETQREEQDEEHRKNSVNTKRNQSVIKEGLWFVFHHVSHVSFLTVILT